jgi:predicted ArsR family transcriptional regulator
MAEAIRRQLLDGTRGRIISLLQSGGLTTDDIASELGQTRSAVRMQVAAMERDGLVRRVGKRPGTTRPSQIFELTREVEQLLSKAYVPLLLRLVDVLAEALPGDQLDAVLRQTGKALAEQICGGRRLDGDIRARAALASELLNHHLGATTRVEQNGRLIIRGAGCPLAALTGAYPGLCLAMEATVAEIVGARVRACCVTGERPQCSFEIPLHTP